MIPQNELAKALKVSIGFIDPKLPGLHVAHFHFLTLDTFEIVATDGHRLVTIEFTAPHSCPPGSRVSMPLPMIEDILEKFPADGEADITLAFWDDNLLITNGTEIRTVRGPKPEDYPDYSQPIGDVAASADPMDLDAKLLARILKDCGVFSPRKKDGTARIELTRSGGAAPIRLRFTLDPELAAISKLTAYLMPLSPITGRAV